MPRWLRYMAPMAVMLLLISEKPVLALPLTLARRDKLLTIRPKSIEFLHQGFIVTHPWFVSFVGNAPRALTNGMEEVDLFLWQERLVLARAK